ncbi:uncharacterized protein LOC116844169 [Odontomachus brunneus]|uniref:uncharacterized protein LOC116844169 n=1 Tax=Odontomachus brunneus TaxID=486640 RepID=UPI0013F26C08|nr:uncharacterized protein LOC116844169 [Odontomachus brunneus]
MKRETNSEDVRKSERSDAKDRAMYTHRWKKRHGMRHYTSLNNGVRQTEADLDSTRLSGMKGQPTDRKVGKPSNHPWWGAPSQVRTSRSKRHLPPSSATELFCVQTLSTFLRRVSIWKLTLFHRKCLIFNDDMIKDNFLLFYISIL